MMKPLSFSKTLPNAIYPSSQSTIPKIGRQIHTNLIRQSPTSKNSIKPRVKRNLTTIVSPPIKRKGFRTVRWLWRLTYLSAIGGLAYVGYGIYENRSPSDQPLPDPSKKTLVVLGKYCTHQNNDNYISE